jgi:hypothetical protein
MKTNPKLTSTSKPNLNDRLSAAAAARKALIEGFKTKRDDPDVLARQAALKEISAAREARRSQRQADKEAEAVRLAAEAAARDAEEKRLAQETKINAAALEAERKAARDARYAARKARR